MSSSGQRNWWTTAWMAIRKDSLNLSDVEGAVLGTDLPVPHGEVQKV